MSPTPVAAVLVITIVASFCAPAAAQPASQDPPESYKVAQAHYEVGHYLQAFELFARLADQGHCDSVRIVRQMATLGRKLYPVDFEVDARRLRRWQQVTACAVATAGR
ncbi:MAG: hypothetical protein JNM07_15455 [Phycisphaerae bacterium]|jgi:hypothetical protein|nr:hypothetical protein [Phycisphaerae bacterium]